MKFLRFVYAIFHVTSAELTKSGKSLRNSDQGLLVHFEEIAYSHVSRAVKLAIALRWIGGLGLLLFNGAMFERLSKPADFGLDMPKHLFDFWRLSTAWELDLTIFVIWHLTWLLGRAMHLKNPKNSLFPGNQTNNEEGRASFVTITAAGFIVWAWLLFIIFP